LTGQIMLPDPWRIGPAGAALGAGVVQRASLLVADARELHAPRDELLLDVDDLLVALRDDRGDLALAVFEPVEPPLGRNRFLLRGPHAVDDARVLLGHPLHELGALEQVGEPVGVEDHGHDVRLVGLVELDEPLAQRGARLGQPGAQLDEPDALLAQQGLEPVELGALALQVGLDPHLPRLERRDVVLERVDPPCPAGDRRGEDALAILPALDRAPLLIDPGRQRRAVGQHGREQPERERQRGEHRDDAQAGHPARHARRPPARGRAFRTRLWSMQRTVQIAGISSSRSACGVS
jgi:hypothetical protein